jgi:hypothetical protein
MLEKLATHDMKHVSKLFSLADKCARAAEGCAWHSQPTTEVGKAGKHEADAIAQSSGKNNKKKKSNNNNKSLAGAPTVVAIAAMAGGVHGPCGDKRHANPSAVMRVGHTDWCHNAEECQEIKKFAKQFHEH